jgi:hypothetical protein
MAEQPYPDDSKADDDVKFWRAEIDVYERTTDKWHKRGRKIYKKYKDVRSPREEASTRLNVLWANVQVRLPALYARDPNPEVERRYKDRDPVGRQVAEVLERCLDFTVRHVNPFRALMRQVVLDYELPGRGTAWVRYVPHFQKSSPEQYDQGRPAGVQDNDDQGEGGHAREEEQGAIAGNISGEITDNEQDVEEGEETEELHYEECLFDYVYWEDFGHTWARTWEEVDAVWRRVYLTRAEGKKRFGKIFEEVPLDWSPKNLNETKILPAQKKAIVYEIWCKSERKAYWICKNFPKCIDSKDDPLHLENFFPCPPPLFANLTGDELIPTPNFIYYQDQANEIDELSSRINAITKALKVAGIYDTSAPGLDRLLAEGTENQLVPVDGYAAIREKGGIKGVMELLPLEEIAAALGHLREQRQGLIDDVFQITGIADIVRGFSDPEESATAQQMKGKFTVLRISDAQTEVQRFCRDLLRIAAEIIADFDLETIKKISGVKLLTDQEKAILRAQLAPVQPPMPALPQMGGPPNQPQAARPQLGAPPAPMPGAGTANVPAVQQPQGKTGGAIQGAGGGAGPQPGQPAAVGGAQPPGSTELTQLLTQPTWEQVDALLTNLVLRDFKIDIETDSTIWIDEEADRTARLEFITAVGNFITQAMTTPPALIPAVGELFQFGVRGFKVARTLEQVFEDCFDKLKNSPPPPNPEVIKAQMEGQTAQAVAQARAQADIQIASSKAQVETQADAARAQLEAQRDVYVKQITLQHEAAIAAQKHQVEAQRVQYEKAADERIANARNATDVQIAEMKTQHEAAMKAADQAHEQRITGMNQAHEQRLAAHKSETDKMLETMRGTNTKEVEGVKGQHAQHVESIKGAQQERLAHVKPALEQQHRVAAESAIHEPHTKALEELAEAMKQLRKPRKVVRDEHGRVSEIH